MASESDYNELYDGIALGYGLDYRVNRTIYKKARSDTLYANKSNITSLTSLNNVADSYFFPSAPTACSLSSSNPLDDQQTITIVYYPDYDSEYYTTQNVMLNGTTPIVCPANIFRVKRMISNSTLNGDVKCVVSAIPNNILSTIESGYNFSRDPHFWVPHNHIGVVIDCTILSTCNDSLQAKMKAKRYPSFLAGDSYALLVQDFPVCFSHLDINLETQPPLPQYTTYALECDKLMGTSDPELTVLYQMILFKTE